MEALVAVERGEVDSVQSGYEPLVDPTLFRKLCAIQKELLPSCSIRQSRGPTVDLVAQVLSGEVDAALVTLPVFGGGLNMSRCGWETEPGPGRHLISSAYLWYLRNPCGGLVEYYTNEDSPDAAWVPREHESTPENFAEGAIVGGIDAKTRRQKR
jgi:hypothetical protein